MDKDKKEVVRTELQFSVNGDFVTQIAREKCHIHGDFDAGLNILIECLCTDQLTPEEIRHIAIDILDGKAIIKGVFPNDDYGVEYLEKSDKNYNIAKTIKKFKNKYDTLQEEYDKLIQKFCIVTEDLEPYEIRRLNNKYIEEYGEKMFEDITDSLNISIPSTGNKLLDSYIKRQMSDTDDDYGWLEPNGTFHPVEWGEHQSWADSWLKEHLDEDAYLDTMLVSGDEMTNRGWILLHNPAQGIAMISRNHEKRITKAQKDFLFDYYTKRDCAETACSIFEME